MKFKDTNDGHEVEAARYTPEMTEMPSWFTDATADGRIVYQTGDAPHWVVNTTKKNDDGTETVTPAKANAGDWIVFDEGSTETALTVVSAADFAERYKAAE